jgi:aminoglycoside phosphotransferase (APT) family kinase protein
MSRAAGEAGPSRDVDDVLAGFLAWLRAADPAREHEVVGSERPTVGFSSETLLVDLRGADRVVLKLPPVGAGIFPVYDFVLQARVQTAVAAAGIPAPVPAEAEVDTRWLGASFLVMPAVPGHIVSEMPVRDRWLTGDPARSTTVHHAYLDLLADIHRIDWAAAGLEGVVPQRDNRAELRHWRDYLDWYGGGTVLVPLLDEALDWCDEHRPAVEPPPSLLWGDVRLGNVVFDEAGRAAAVLDWEMASIGAAEHDLAWTLSLDATQAELFQRTVPGFLDPAGAIRRYEARLGRTVQDLDWYETLAMVRSIAIMTRVAHLRDVAGLPGLFEITDNPLLGILARRLTSGGGRL